MPPRAVSNPTVSRSRVTAARRCIGDVALLGREIPFFPVERTMPLGHLAAVRETAAVRIGWAAVFLKAYARVAEEMPILRTWYVRGLFPRLATASESVATLAVNRVADGEDRLCFGRLRRPEARGLVDIQRFIGDCGTKPVEEMFKRQLQLEMLPGVVRRIVLRWNMNSLSPKRASRIGTFSMSTLAGLGATNRFHPTLCTTSLSYAPLESDGRCLVTLIADHRVLDGAAAARALERLEAVLCGEIVRELAGLSPASARTTADDRGAAA